MDDGACPSSHVKASVRWWEKGFREDDDRWESRDMDAMIGIPGESRDRDPAS